MHALTKLGGVIRKAEERDALQNIEIAFESVRAVWSGVEFRKSAERWRAMTRRDSGETGQMASWLRAPLVDDPLTVTTGGDVSVAEQQMRRMERQVGVLERAAATGYTTGLSTPVRETMPAT